ncbi:response regulator transcription factor [Candidatus Omnitrophota bacterium]
MSKILIIDDEPQLIGMLRASLEANGYKVISAPDGEEGLKQASMEKPDLILLDIMMPGMDGLEVLTRLKNDLETNSIPVIMLTAKGGTSAIMEAQRSFATDYVIKPFETEHLLRLIKAYLRTNPDI